MPDILCLTAFQTDYGIRNWIQVIQIPLGCVLVLQISSVSCISVISVFGGSAILQARFGLLFVLYSLYSMGRVPCSACAGI